MVTAILWLLDRFQGLFTRLGADFPSLRSIVEMKLLMDTRRNHSMLGRSHQPASGRTRLWLVYALNAFFSLFVALMIVFIPSVMTGMTIYFTFLIVMIALTLITDYAELLIDTTDNAILLPRPVNSRTLWLARLVHLVTYVSVLSLSMALIPAGAAGYRFGWWMTPVVLLLSAQAVLLAVFLTTLIYLLVIRFSSEEKLKDVIAYLQIGMSVFFMVGYQIVPRLLRPELSQMADDSLHAWHFAAPPAWLAGVVDLLVTRVVSAGHLALLALAVGAPPALLWFNTRYLATHFTTKLAAIGAASGGPSTRQKTSGLGVWLGGLLTRNATERASFELSWVMTGRDRRFQMRAYPALGFMLPMLFVVLRPLLDGQMIFEDLREGRTYLLLIYSLQIVAGSFYLNTLQSEDFRATWIYDAAPVASPGDIILGNFKAVILKFFTPFYLVLSAGMLYVWGPGLIDDLLAGYTFALFITSLEAWIKSKDWKLPFSREPKAKADSGRGVILLAMLFFVLPLFGVAHWGSTFVPGGTFFMFLLYGALLWGTTQSYRKLTWDQFSE